MEDQKSTNSNNKKHKYLQERQKCLQEKHTHSQEKHKYSQEKHKYSQDHPLPPNKGGLHAGEKALLYWVLKHIKKKLF